MTERGIILSGDNIQLAYDGRKTATRRLLKIPKWLSEIVYPDREFRAEGLEWVPWLDSNGAFHWRHQEMLRPLKCPYGQPGDRLYVKEAFFIGGPNTWGMDGSMPLDIKIINPDSRYHETAYFKAGWTRVAPHWKSSRFMPKWAARIWLEITSIRLERLQDISADGARAEGIGIKSVGPASDLAAQNQFALLWNQIHKNAAKAAGVDYAWDLNPFVWAIGFKRTEAP